MCVFPLPFSQSIVAEVDPFPRVLVVVGFGHPLGRQQLPRRRFLGPLTKGGGRTSRQFQPPLPFNSSPVAPSSA